MASDSKVSTCLWFDDQALEAAEFYCSLIPDSRIDHVARITNADGSESVSLVEFTLAGSPYMALNGGDYVELSEAASIFVRTENQAETDRLWDALIAHGGTEGRCGWIKDRFGLWWQIVPKRYFDLISGSRSGSVQSALMHMNKIDIAALEVAAGVAT